MASIALASIALISPLSSQGQIAPSSAIHQGELAFAQEMLLSWGPTAVASTLAAIDRVVDTEDAEDRPSEYAKRRIVHLLAEAQNVSRIYIAASDVEGFEGSLLVHWTAHGKRVVLISPRSEDKPPSLYRKVADGWSELMQDPTPTDLAASLAWVLQA